MPKCINLSIPQVVDDLNELTRILRNEDAAYAVLAKNNENSLEYNLQGNPSELFNQLLVATKGNRPEAIRLKSVIYTSEFLNKTEWMDKGEPTIGEVMAFVESMNPVEKTTDTKAVVMVAFDEVKSSNLYDSTNKNLQSGSVVEYAPAEKEKTTWLVRGVNSSGKVQLIDKDGSNFSGTPDVKSVNVIGSYPTVEFNKVQYIVADNNEIYSSATGKKVFEGQDETSQKAKKLILDKAFEEYKRSKLSPVLNAIKNGTRVFTMATKNRLNSMEMFAREELLAKGFEYVEKDDVGFYSVPGIQNQEEIKEENGNLKLNRVEIDLRKLGITFELTADQKQFLQTFADWLDDSNPTMRGKNFLLNGYAGTGKTTVMNVALEYAKNTRKKMVLTATTAKAADVQRKMYGATAVTSTLHSALGIAPTRDNTLKEIKSSLKPGDILVIDESSMIDDKLYAEIKQRGYKTIFIGDDAQFKPVKKGALSKVFDTSDKVVSKLTSLVRQGEGNVLIETLTKLRTNQETAQNPLGDKMDSKIDQTTQTGLEWNYGAEFNDRIKEMFTSDEYKKNPDFVKLLVAANWEVEKYNKEIRRHLGFKQEIEVGEVMVGYENVQYGKDEDQFKNGSDYKVTEVSYNANVTVPNPLNSADPFHLPLISVSMENVLTGEVIMDHILSRNVPAAEMQKLVEVYKELDQQYKSARGELKRNIEKKLDFLDSQFMNMENIVSPDYKDRWGKEVILKSKVIDYGYAITVHKSQGSGYQYVLVDEAGISTIQSKYGDILGGNQSRYVSFSRAFKGVIARTHKPLGTKDRFDFSKKTSGSDKIIATFESVALDAMNEDGLVGKNCKL